MSHAETEPQHEVTVSNELINQLKQTNIELDSEEAYDLATDVTDSWLMSSTGKNSNRKLHLPRPSEPTTSACHRTYHNEYKQTPTSCYPPGYSSICTYCFAWLLASHYPDVLFSDEDGDEQ